MEAKELQQIKIKAELEISRILDELNQVCCENNFQVEEISLTTIKTDFDRKFDVDIHIV